MSTLLPLSINVNVNGLPTISSLGVNVTATQVAFDFNNHPNVGSPFRGLIVVRLNQPIPTGTATTLPIVFTSEGGNAKPLLGYDSTPITVADIPGTGIYLVWWESQTDTLQLLTGID